jgi:hypothetical protein
VGVWFASRGRLVPFTWVPALRRAKLLAFWAEKARRRRHGDDVVTLLSRFHVCGDLPLGLSAAADRFGRTASATKKSAQIDVIS